MQLLEALPKLISWAIPLIILAVIILPQAIRILREYERGVIFRLGKLLGAKGPGLIFLIPIVDRMVRMDLRVVTISVEKQEVMTRDNVPVTVDAVVYFRVIDPQAAVVKVENFLKATSLMSQTTLRSVLGQAPLDDLLSQRESINLKLQEIIDRQTEPWGVKVTAVEVKDVSLPDTMKRAMAKQAEAERERRAKIVNAEGEFQAAEKMVQAAVVKVENFLKATSLMSQTTLRSVLGQAPLDDLLSQRESINQKLQEIIDRQTEPWGVKVTAVEVKDVALPDTMKRAMAKQAEAERERRAKIVNAEGEFQAAEKMVQAAAMMSKEPIALQLRFLQTMREISSEHNTTTFFPLPIDLLTALIKKSEPPK